MNILFYRYNSIYEPDMIEAFRLAGLTVIEITEEMDEKEISNARRAELLEKAIGEYTPLFVYGINYYSIIAEVCRIKNVLYLSQTVDSPILSLFDKSLCNSTNRVFLFDRAQYELYSQYNKEGVFHLPLASAVGRFDKVIQTIDDEDRSKFSCDISFVGSTYREKDPLSDLKGLSEQTWRQIDELIEECSFKYGSYDALGLLDDQLVDDIKEAAGEEFPWFNGPAKGTDRYVVSHRYIGSHLAVIERERTLNFLAEHFKVDLFTRSDTSTLRGVRVHPGIRTLDEMPKVFNLSRINLNITMRPIEKGLPLRCFDILGCGGFLMTNFQEELEDMFVIGEDLECYSSLDELIEKCRYYLSHEEERAAIARRGYEKVCAAHTHIHRMNQMLKNL